MRKNSPHQAMQTYSRDKFDLELLAMMRRNVVIKRKREEEIKNKIKR